jgi:hypothetical protein
MPKSYAVTAKKGLCLHREIVEDRDEFIHVAAHDIVVDAQEGASGPRKGQKST